MELTTLEGAHPPIPGARLRTHDSVGGESCMEAPCKNRG